MTRMETLWTHWTNESWICLWNVPPSDPGGSRDVWPEDRQGLVNRNRVPLSSFAVLCAAKAAHLLGEGILSGWMLTSPQPTPTAEATICAPPHVCRGLKFSWLYFKICSNKSETTKSAFALGFLKPLWKWWREGEKILPFSVVFFSLQHGKSLVPCKPGINTVSFLYFFPIFLFLRISYKITFFFFLNAYTLCWAYLPIFWQKDPTVFA